MEQRFNPLSEISSANGRKFSGYAATFGTMSSPDALPFREVIKRGAFTRCLRDSNAVMLLNHDPNMLLGKQSAGTLRLAEDERGLRVECDLPESPLGDNVRAAIARRDLDGMSFGFVADDDEWTDEQDAVTGERYSLRTIRSFRSLADVSVCTFPAYPGTSANVRNMFPGGVPAEIRSRFPQLTSKSARESVEKRHASDFREYLRGARRAEDVRAASNDYFGRPIPPETYTGGPSGGASGVLVPAEFGRNVMANAVKQTSGFLLDPNVVTLDQSGDYSLRGKVFPAWDLTATAAVRVGEVTQTDPNSYTAPPSYAKFAQSWIYRISLPVAIELLQDTGDEILAALSTAYGEAFARGVGADLINGQGSGSSQPSGLLTGAVDSTVSGAANLAFFTNLYFSLNRRHRADKKCAWVLTDSVYKKIRNLQDDDHRPLIHISEDGETLFGKPVYVSPDLNDFSASPSVTGKVVFGNLRHFLVRCSTMTVTKSMESAASGGIGDITRGEVLLSGRMRVDSTVHDASSGTVPPVLFASVTA